MSDVNNLVDPKVSASGEAKSLAFEKFTGQIKRAYHEQLGLMSYFDLQEVTGTNIVSNKYLGVTQVQALAPGKDVRGGEMEFDKNSLLIDTTVIARNVVGLLDDVQDDIMVKGKLAEEQVSALKNLEDRMLLQQLIFGAINNTKTKRTKPRVKGHGFSVVKKIKETDALFSPNKLIAGIEWVIEDLVLQNVDVRKLTIFMPWPEFNAMRDAERICNARYNTAQGQTVTGFVLKSYNVPVVPTNQFPNKSRDHIDLDGNVADHHILSNANNGYRYDVLTGTDGEDQEKAAAVIFGSEALLVGRSIALTGEIWWNKGNKTWYIDSYMSEGAIPDRWEHLGLLIKAADDEAGLDKRAARKAQVTQSADLTGDASAFVAAVQAVLAANP
ncbi:major capsid protein [Vibrio phage vB_ValA_R15Z]|nr:major capsid protein [Vibrio phage vB_ValA_R15Z]